MFSAKSLSSLTGERHLDFTLMKDGMPRDELLRCGDVESLLDSSAILNEDTTQASPSGLSPGRATAGAARECPVEDHGTFPDTM